MFDWLFGWKKKSKVNRNIVIGSNNISCSGNIIVKNGEVWVDGECVSKGNKDNITLEINGDVTNIQSNYSVVINGNVSGDVDAGGSVEVSGDVSGHIDSGGSITCGNVGEYVDAGGSVTCGNVKGDVDANGSVNMRR